ncbi:MAG: LacI family transcriptional regulator [Anaerolineae bacterium]|nr:LacI family transcriptional regulator [Anaerolineae bacterium]
MELNSPVTIFDVAQAAGVSVSTVSRILNEKPDVSEKTRQHVLNIINELGFVPHAQARRLATRESQTIALLDPINRKGERAIDQLHLDFMIGAATAAGEQNYFFNVIATPITERNLLDLYRQVHVDGVILMEIYQDDWRVNLLRDKNHPFVMIGRCADNTGLSFIELDIEASTHLAVEHLVALGHQKIGFITYPTPMREKLYGPAMRSWSGYHAALEKHNLTPYVREINFTIPEMAEATSSLLDEESGLTAIFSLTDAPINGALSVLKERGYSLPQEFSIVGLAIDRIAEIMAPKLTAIRFPSYQMGYQAASMLIEKLQNDPLKEEQILLVPELIERETTGMI